MRVGDKLVKITDVTSQGRGNEFDITPTTSVDEVRNHLRGDPGTSVDITFLREGVGGGKVNEPQTITLERNVVRIPDVKYFGFIGDPSDGIGYIDLSGFANDAGREVRYAIRALQHGATELAAVKDAPRDESGMLAADPTSLKVCSFCLLCNCLTVCYYSDLFCHFQITRVLFLISGQIPEDFLPLRLMCPPCWYLMGLILSVQREEDFLKLYTGARSIQYSIPVPSLLF